MNRELTNEELSNLELKKTKKGFCVWITEMVKVNKFQKEVKIRHWLIDASTIKMTGELEIGLPLYYNYFAKKTRQGIKIFCKSKFNKSLKD